MDVLKLESVTSMLKIEKILISGSKIRSAGLYDHLLGSIVAEIEKS